MDPTRVHRHRYIIEDPARFGCLCAAAALLFLPDVPFILTLLVVGVTQLAPILMAARALEQGWSHRYGKKVHASVFASSLSMDFTNLAACTVVGALLLVRHFNGVEIVRPLGILTVAVCFLPDIRLCRWLLAGDPMESSRQLREGSFLRDPVMLSAMVAMAVIGVLDRESLQFVFLSLLFLQLNTLFVLLDKYLPEIESRFHGGWKLLVLEREGRRLWVPLATLLLVPLRITLGDRACWWSAGLLAGVIVAPDVFRLAMTGVRAVANQFRVTPHPATYIVLPK